MAINRIQINDFLEFAKSHPVLDVRSPGEYEHAHIPGALSFPLFTNEERKIVGTAYKQQSRENAIKIGLDYFGKNLVSMVENAEKILKEHPSGTREIGVHCWRGGMRSAAVAWLLDLYGFKVTVLTGGYKTYRHWVLQQFEKNHTLCILGGNTGSNKTGLLNLYAKTNRVIDLEALANHKGSAFGNLNQEAQPGQEHFENLLAMQLHGFSDTRSAQAIWLEAESQRLGSVNIPFSFFIQMRQAPMVYLQVPFEARLDYIVEDYGKFEKEKLINALLRIKKKLGGLELKNAINFLLEEDTKSCFAILLKYYDKLYLKGLQNNEFKSRTITYIESDTIDAHINLQKLNAHVNQ
ncbi:MAG: tRNA 2-selenouridine(34) synthase MnmH [Bacteroidia bacterium]|nr:tRNA 2-selenouridine(34) synthase MnmH [Bacteroidia bacterium]